MSSTAALLSDSAYGSPLPETRALIARIAGPECNADSALDSAEERAGAFAGSLAETPSARSLSAVILAADAVAGLALERGWHSRDVDELADGLGGILGLPADEIRLAVYLGAIDDPRLLELPPVLAIETTLRLLAAFAAAPAASFWLCDADGSLRCVARIGTGARMRASAEAALRQASLGSGRTANAAPVHRWQRTAGIVAVGTRARSTGPPAVYVREAARILGLALERELLLDRSSARERALVAASERRLTRLGYDVHDGPLQDVGAVRRELCLVQDAVARALAPGPGRDALLAQLAHVEEIALTAEAGLRDLAQAAESPAILARPFRRLVENELARFQAATNVVVEAHLEGDLDTLTGSQRIALAHIVHEALNNVREHSSAASVRVSIARRAARVEAEIIDDGRGFVVEQTLVRAARRGRLGVVGMSERALLLGGVLDVRSVPGGPTTVSVSLPEWRPLTTIGDATAATKDLDAAALVRSPATCPEVETR